MEAIEPIKFEVVGPGIELDESYDGCQISQWDETHNYFLHQSVSEHFDFIDKDKYVETINQAILDEVSDFHEVISVDRNVWAQPFGFPVPGSLPIYLREGVILFPYTDMEGVFFIISNNNREARSVRDEIISALRDLKTTFGGAGVEEINIDSGSDFTREMILSNPDISDVETGESDEFEEEIYDTLSPITEALAPNQIVDFGGHPQNREYDILFALSSDNILHISLKNYAGVDASPTAEDVISDPQDIASLLGADMTISVVKGIEDEELMGTFRREIELRDSIELCTETECVTKVREYIEKEMLPPLFSDRRLNLHSGETN